MADPDRRLPSHTEYGRVVAQMVRRSAVAESDRAIIQNSRQAIQRSRELLEATKHQVLRPSQRDHQNSSTAEE